MDKQQTIDAMISKTIELMKKANPDMALKHISPIVDAFIDNYVGWREALRIWGHNDEITYNTHSKYLALQELIKTYNVDVGNLREEAQAVNGVIEEEE